MYATVDIHNKDSIISITIYIIIIMIRAMVYSVQCDFTSFQLFFFFFFFFFFFLLFFFFL